MKSICIIITAAFLLFAASPLTGNVNDQVSEYFKGFDATFTFNRKNNPVYRVYSKQLSGTFLVFENMEILYYVCADPVNWHVEASKTRDTITIKPTRPDIQTSLLVTVQRGSEQYHLAFNLIEVTRLLRLADTVNRTESGGIDVKFPYIRVTIRTADSIQYLAGGPSMKKPPVPRMEPATKNGARLPDFILSAIATGGKEYKILRNNADVELIRDKDGKTIIQVQDSPNLYFNNGFNDVKEVVEYVKSQNFIITNTVLRKGEHFILKGARGITIIRKTGGSS